MMKFFPEKKILKKELWKKGRKEKAFFRFKMHEWCKKSKKKNRRCDVDDAILNEYRWLGSSPKQEEEKKRLQSVAMFNDGRVH